MKTLRILLAIVFACVLLHAAENITLPPSGSAAMLELNKSAQPSAVLGETITVTLEIRNGGASAVSVVVQDDLGNVDPVNPQPIYANISEDLLARPPYLTWSVNLGPGGSEILSYTVKPKTVGPLSMGPARAYAGGKVFHSNSLFIDVACSDSPECDESVGETPLTCPAKCAAANASGDTTPDFQPQPVPSEPIGPVDANARMAEVTAEEKKADDEKNGQLLLIGGVAVVLIAVAAYFLFMRKKPAKPAENEKTG